MKPYGAMKPSRNPQQQKQRLTRSKPNAERVHPGLSQNSIEDSTDSSQAALKQTGDSASAFWARNSDSIKPENKLSENLIMLSKTFSKHIPKQSTIDLELKMQICSWKRVGNAY